MQTPQQAMQTPQQARTPSLISEQQRKNKFIVPIYQRLFVWEDFQIITLLDDLKTAMNHDSPYYIGVITVVEKGNQWEIVDGQQRLTFLTLFGCECLRRKFLPERWNRFIRYGEEDDALVKEKALRIHYFGRKEDEIDIERMLSDGDDFSITQVNNVNFRMFHDCFERVMRSFSTIEERIKFVKYVFEQASFLISELPSTYSPLDLNLFFEKMNSAGRQLEPVEIVKGKYFAADAQIWNACMNIDEPFKDATPAGEEEAKVHTILDIIDDTNSQVKEEVDDLKELSYNRLVMSPSVFLLHVLQLSIPDGDVVLRDPTRLLETFEKHVPSQNLAKFVKNFLEYMVQYRKWLDQNIIYLKRGADGSFEYLFRNEQRETAEEDCQRVDSRINEVASKDRMMKQFQSMLYVSSSDFQEWVFAMFKKNGQSSLDLKTLKAWDLDNMKQAYESCGNWDYWTINRYWFWKLDYILWEMVYNGKSLGYELSQQEEVAIKNYVFRRNRSIEHLHPQASVNDLWKNDLHGFGNLALISVGFNSQQSDDPFYTKYGRMTSKIMVGDLESIKLLLMFKIAKRHDNNWTPEVAQMHAQEMHEILENFVAECALLPPTSKAQSATMQR